MVNLGDGFNWDAEQAAFSDVQMCDFFDAAATCRKIAAAHREAVPSTSIAWDLIADVCSLVVDGSKTMTPFKPCVVVAGRRSFDVQDANPEDLDRLSAVVNLIPRADIAARIHDVLWVCRYGTGIEHALAALEFFRQIPISSIGFRFGLVTSWERSISLAWSLGRVTAATAQDLEMNLSARLKALASDGDILAIMLSRMMIRRRINTLDAGEFADAMASQGDAATTTVPGGPIQFLECARDWYRLGHFLNRANDMSIALAEASFTEGLERANADNPSFMMAAHHLEIAIQHYRNTSQKFRTDRGLDRRLAEIRSLHRGFSQRATEEFERIDGGTIDLTEAIREAEERVKGKDLLPALVGFITVAPLPSAKELSMMHRDRLKSGSISDLFGRSIVTNDGRIVHKVPPLESDSEDEVVASHVINSHQMYIGALVQGAITPALKALSVEHHVSREFLYELALESPAVPHGREWIFAMGLAAGFDWDFITSSHLLIPQIESFLRHHLKSRGINTTSMDAQGLEAEKTLTPLLDLAKEHGVILEF